MNIFIPPFTDIYSRLFMLLPFSAIASYTTMRYPKKLYNVEEIAALKITKLVNKFSRQLLTFHASLVSHENFWLFVQTTKSWKSKFTISDQKSRDNLHYYMNLKWWFPYLEVQVLMRNEWMNEWILKVLLLPHRLYQLQRFTRPVNMVGI